MTATLIALSVIALIGMAACLCEIRAQADERIEEAFRWKELDRLLEENHIDHYRP